LEAWRWYLASVRQLPHSFESETQKVWLMLITGFINKGSLGLNWTS
jgi:hypothetical protein